MLSSNIAMWPSTKFSVCSIVRHSFEAFPLTLTVEHLLRYCLIVNIFRVYLHDVSGRLCQIVQRFHPVVNCTSVANTDVAIASVNVRLYHPVLFRVGNKRDRLIDMFQIGISREFRRDHKVTQNKLVLNNAGVSENFKHAGQKADVAQVIELYIMFEVYTLKVREHLLGRWRSRVPCTQCFRSG